MMRLLAVRNFLYKPWRSLLLFLGFGLGVSVMIILLSIGEAMVDQAQDERLVGGGNITVLPDGMDIEVMKTGGLGSLFLSINNARFVYLQLLAKQTAAPQDDDELLYLTTPDGVERPVLAAGDIPSAQRAVGVMPVLAAGTWTDDSADRRWIAPTRAELENDIDHFHTAATDPTWAEWHYFNVLSSDHARWAFITFIVGARGARMLVTTHATEKPAQRFTADIPPSAVRTSTTRADVTIGASSVTVLPDGRYSVHVRIPRLSADLVVSPRPGAYFPGAPGYTVPALIADASGQICIDAHCEAYDRVQAYHDHNWGVWRGVTWDWGAARMGQYGVLYGRVRAPDSVSTSAPVFVYLVDSSGFRAMFRPERIVYDDDKRVPRHATLADVHGADTLRLDLDIEDASVTDHFVQMKGVAHLSGRAGGGVLAGVGAGFFETYR
ncbi:MAG TPA: hypothetical protein VK679_17345 [Gemmatimonadaceae bacterium]|jgi:hypothetical protein|nr:hypothetical protein [Gemmatimonadaceae bacterium]